MNIVEMNRKLIENYGKDVGSNRPRYRLVWSTAERENRRGTFADYTPEGIYLRTVTEVRNVEKYPQFLDMWVLEVLQGNDSNPELMSSYSYEPLWVFGANNSAMMPEWDKLDLIVHAHKFIEVAKVSESDIREIEANKFIKEKALFKDMLQDESPYIPGAIHAGAAVVVPRNYEKVEVKDKEI